MIKKVELSATDMAAIREGADAYLNNKGANLYKEDTYYQSVEYYRLAAAMGEVHSVSNLGSSPFCKGSNLFGYLALSPGNFCK